MYTLFNHSQLYSSFRRIIALSLIVSITGLFACSDDEDNILSQFLANVSISVSGTSLSEDSDDITVTITLSTDNTLGTALGIPLTIGGTATNGQDYQQIASSLQIAAGSNTAQLTIDVIDDSEVEGNETITIGLDTSLLPEGISAGSQSNISITIQDNDEAVSDCTNDNSIDQDNFDCDESPSVANVYIIASSNERRTITTNGIPTHDFRNQIPRVVSQLNSSTKSYAVNASPTKASSTTELTNNGRPAWRFGVATNGVVMDPAPAEPFIFENPNTGEFNYDWVFEPNWNMRAVGLDCAIAHVQPDGTYHYHGDMGVYADQLLSGLGSGTTTPTAPIQIGWAADGFPIIYKFGPDESGNLKELLPGYQIRSGERPGDGITEPCGTYNGKYTRDFEYIAGSGDLDECNGVDRNITIGDETFTYFYVITSDFPVIPRCLVGSPDMSFRLGG